MKILDEQDNEITLKDVNENKGYLVVEKNILHHFDAIQEQKEISHFKVKSFRFTDGTSYSVIDEDDPHVRIIDAVDGIFDYIPQDGEVKELCGIDIDRVIDSPYVAPQEAWDDIEYIQRYKIYTPSELKAKQARDLEEAEKEKFINDGPRRMRKMERQIRELQKQLNALKDR